MAQTIYLLIDRTLDDDGGLGVSGYETREAAKAAAAQIYTDSEEQGAELYLVRVYANGPEFGGIARYVEPEDDDEDEDEEDA